MRCSMVRSPDQMRGLEERLKLAGQAAERELDGLIAWVLAELQSRVATAAGSLPTVTGVSGATAVGVVANDIFPGLGDVCRW